MHALYPAPGVFGHLVYTNYDETINAFVIAGDTANAKSAVERELAKLGVPAGKFRAIVSPRHETD